MAYVDFILPLHNKAKRDYLLRVVEHDKAACAEVAVQFGKDYWDGDRKHGYGGYHYDGRWRSMAEAMVKYYDLKPGARILDVGCGKGFLLYEFTQILPDCQIVGLDISDYALEHAKEEVKPYLQLGNANHLPFPDRSFDFVVAVNTLHNLYNYDLFKAIQEIERVGRGSKQIIVDAYRTERERVNLMYWQLTCRVFYTPQEWEWLFQQAGYTGDYCYVAFE